jgi:hypothetical protein
MIRAQIPFIGVFAAAPVAPQKDFSTCFAIEQLNDS